uniref:Ig-like domain-containing protein n=1 Tax=Labrus bergylta TaxID=56723 RepID=A0A3Q3F4F0_9LABR
MELWLWIILASLLFEDVFASEGDTVTLDCKVETIITTLYLFWYRQEMGDFPKYLYKAAINGTSVPLTIQKLQLTDSAVYYCALRPKVTGNTTTLYKTSGEKTTQYSTTSTRGTSDRTTQHQLILVLPLHDRKHHNSPLEGVTYYYLESLRWL